MTSQEIDMSVFGGYSMDKEVFLYLREHLPTGKTILELGSGRASNELSKLWNVISIEHNEDFVDSFKTVDYIFAPIKDGWYDRDRLTLGLDKSYDCIIIDGPPADIGRTGFMDNLDLFDLKSLIIFDDINRPSERTMFEDFCQQFNVSVFDEFTTQGTWHLGPYTKQFAAVDLRNE